MQLPNKKKVSYNLPIPHKCQQWWEDLYTHENAKNVEIPARQRVKGDGKNRAILVPKKNEEDVHMHFMNKVDQQIEIAINNNMPHH